MVLETHMKWCVTARFFRKNFSPKNKGNRLKIGFFDLKKISIICCVVPAQILYLGNIVFVRYRPKCFQHIRLQNFLVNFFFLNKSMKQPHFWHVDTNSQKLKVDRKFFS